MHLGEGRDIRFSSLYDDGKTLLRAPDLSDPLLLMGTIVRRLRVGMAVQFCRHVQLGHIEGLVRFRFVVDFASST